MQRKSAESGLEIAEDIYRRSLNRLKAMQRAMVRKKQDVPRDHADLLRAVSQATEQLRQLEKARVRSVGDLTAKQVLTWAKLQPAETRARLLRDLQELDNPRKLSVLG